MKRNLWSWSLALALLAAPVPALAQESPYVDEPQDAQQEAEGQQPQEGVEDGAGSPEEAAETFLEALKSKDTERLSQTVPPDDRQHFEKYGDTIVESVEVTDYEVRDIEVSAEDETRAHATYSWEIEVDEERMMQGYEEMLRESLREEGVSEEEIDELLDIEMESLRDDLRQHIDELSRTENRMVLEQVDGRWYVKSPVDHEEKEHEGQEQDAPLQEREGEGEPGFEEDMNGGAGLEREGETEREWFEEEETEDDVEEPYRY